MAARSFLISTVAFCLVAAVVLAQQAAQPIEDSTQQLVNRLIGDRDRHMIDAANLAAENARLKREIEQLKQALAKSEAEGTKAK